MIAIHGRKGKRCIQKQIHYGTTYRRFEDRIVWQCQCGLFGQIPLPIELKLRKVG